ncbi:diguanylate cyclase [Massilia glaciei]|uniref:diguanylate cyclase n=1 Tax=Massilia glaciei TaxID=1524097 RepID=UPI0015E82AAA|nr:diguanylate cyclase [Massilia glaciei]
MERASLILGLGMCACGAAFVLSWLLDLPALRFPVAQSPQIGPVLSALVLAMGIAMAAARGGAWREQVSRLVAAAALAALCVAVLAQLLAPVRAPLPATHIYPIPALVFMILGAGLVLARPGKRMLAAGVCAALGLAISVFVLVNLCRWRLNEAGHPLLFVMTMQAAVAQTVFAAALVCLTLAGLEVRGRVEAFVLWSAGAIGVACMLVWAFINWTDAAHVVQEAEQQTGNVSRLLEAHFELGTDAVNLVFDEVERALGTRSLDELAVLDAEGRRLAALAGALPQVRALHLLDAAGRVRAFGAARPQAGPGLRARGFFIAHRGGQRHAFGGIAADAAGAPTFTYSRRLSDARGGFAGVVLAEMEPAYFQRFYRSLELGPGSALSLFRADGRLLFREPILADPAEGDLERHPIFARLIALAPTGRFVGHSPSDHEQKFSNYRLAPRRAFVVVTAIGMDHLGAPFARRFMLSAGVLGALLALLGMAARIQLLGMRRGKALRLAEAASRLYIRSILDSVGSAIVIVDAGGRIVDVNAEWSKFSGENGGCGANYVGCNYLAVCRGVTGEDAKDALAAAAGISAVIAGGLEVFEHTYACHSATGERWYKMRVTPLAESDGSVVVIHQSITDLKLTEAELRRVANTDSLTGLSNRRALVELAERELAQARRQKYPVSIMMLDCDHFKKVNDTYGHGAGDLVLQTLAGIMRAVCRDTDIVGRVGGEEFVALLPHTAMQGALVLAERLREAVGAARVRSGGDTITFTISIGAAAFAPPMSFDELLTVADRGLYKAKAGGRNRVEAAGS